MSQETDEVYTIYNNKCVKAKKLHVCCACKDHINIGHYYHYIFTLYSEGVEVFKRCLKCEAIHAHLIKKCQSIGNEYWPMENLNCGMKYEDEWGPIPEDIAKLAFFTQEEMQVFYRNNLGALRCNNG